MTEESIKFITEVVRPWEKLNLDLAIPLSMHPEINDFITKASSLSVTLKHFPEANKNIRPNTLIPKSQSYEIISDLANSFKHGKLRKSKRECQISISSMFERNPQVKVRFLRNKITIIHQVYGSVDFMKCSMDCALFIIKRLGLKIDWSPKIIDNSGEFLNEIKVHVSKNHQVDWSGMILEIVQINEKGEYENVDLDGQVNFLLTSDFIDFKKNI